MAPDPPESSYGAVVAADLQELVVPDAAALRARLQEHHGTSPGVWLALTKKGGTTTTLTWQQAVDEALSSAGSTARPASATTRPPPCAAPSDAEVPADLAAAIATAPEAQAMFDVLTRTNRYALIHRLTTVKTAKTRRRKIEQFVAMLSRNETPYPQKAKP